MMRHPRKCRFIKLFLKAKLLHYVPSMISYDDGYLELGNFTLRVFHLMEHGVRARRCYILHNHRDWSRTVYAIPRGTLRLFRKLSQIEEGNYN